MTGADLAQFVSDYGLIVLVPLAVIEGPIVTLVAAYLARLALIDPFAVFGCALAGDLIGDSLLYWAGRSAPRDALGRISSRLVLPRRAVVPLARLMRRRGARVLVFAKLTHAAGFATLIAAGAARMNFRTFLAANAGAALPKTAALMAIGYAFGGIGERLDHWISVGSTTIFCVLAASAIVAYALYRRRQKCPNCT